MNFHKFIIILAMISASKAISQPVVGQYLVQLKKGYTVDQLKTSRSITHPSLAWIENSKCVSKMANVYLIKIASESIDDKVSSDFLSHPAVLQFQPNYYLHKRANIPDDPRVAEQWNLERVGATTVWDEITGGTNYHNDTIVVAVMEFGFDPKHEDLQELLWQNRGEVPNNNFDDDQNGYVDDYEGLSLDAGKDQHQPDSDNHGTAVLGVIGARGNNGLGISGINWKVKVLLVTAQDSTMDRAIEAYDYFASMRKLFNDTGGQQGAFIVASNSSFGFEGLFESDAPIFCEMFNLMGAQGILSVGAAENDNGNADVFGDLPAQCSSDDLIIVTSTTFEDKLAVAGYGKTTVDLSAPGEEILTTGPDNSYTIRSGTSFAAPMVAGSIGLLHSHLSEEFANLSRSDPTYISALLKGLLLQYVEPSFDLGKNTVSQGRLDLARTYQALTEMFPASPTASFEADYGRISVLPDRIVLSGMLVNVTVEVFDLTGRRLYLDKNQIIEESYYFRNLELASGIYLCRLSNKNQVIATPFLIK